MEKKDLMKVVVLIGVAVMAGSMLAPSLMFRGSGSGPGLSGEMLTGTTIFNGTIRTYEPFLVVTGVLPSALQNELLADSKVKSITTIPDGQLINTSTRDDVYQLALYLRQNNMESVALANIILPPSIMIKLTNGSAIEAFSSGNVQLWAEPLVDTDTVVLVQMIGTAQDGRLIKYQNPVLLAEKKNIQLNATIKSIESMKYGYTIPWENRSAIDESALSLSYGTGNIEFERNDYISFPAHLGISEITKFKALSYITFISDTSASLNESFTDFEQIKADFGNTSVVFPDSYLVITTNDSVDLPFNYSLANEYILELDSASSGYSFEKNEFSAISTTLYDINDSILVNISGTAFGDRFVDIDSIILN